MQGKRPAALLVYTGELPEDVTEPKECGDGAPRQGWPLDGARRWQEGGRLHLGAYSRTHAGHHNFASQVAGLQALGSRRSATSAEPSLPATALMNSQPRRGRRTSRDPSWEKSSGAFSCCA